MSQIALTDLTVRSLPPGTYMDTRLPGFGIRVGARTKAWIVVRGAGRVKHSIGHYPALSLADARKKALVALGSPLDTADCPTFTAAREEYLAQGKWRERSRYEITRTLHRHFHWTKTIDKITHRDVLEAIEAIKAPSEAAHAFKDIRSMFAWCVPRYLKSSPCQGLKPPSRYVPRSRVLSDAELVKVWNAAEQMGDFGRIIQICITTGMRCGEVLKIKSSFLNENSITIPDSITKNKRQHCVPLSPLASHLIRTSSISIVALGKPKKRLDQLSGVESWTIHDLRRTYATTMQRLGVRLEVTEKLLNHVSGSHSGIVGVYQRHTFDDEMREAVLKYDTFLTELLALRV